MKTSYQLLLVLSLGFGMVSCDKKGSSEDAPVEANQSAEEYKKQIGEYATLQLRSNLPYCGSDNQNQHFYILEYKSFFRCVRKNNMNFWQMVDLRGKKGDRGEDGKFTEWGPSVLQLATGSSHTCGLLEDNSIYCIGSNGFGEINYAKKDSHSKFGEKPENVGHKGKYVAAGGFTTCIITMDDKVRCWGSLRAAGPGYRKLPINGLIGDLHDVTLLEAGDGHVCAVGKSTQFSPVSNTTKEGLYCWGNNDHGQLGVSQPYESIDPIFVDVIPSKLVLTYRTTCGIEKGTDAAFCMGRNRSGLMGIGNNSIDQPRPLTWIGDTGLSGQKLPVLDLSASSVGVCLTKKSDRKLYCTGSNSDNMIDNSNTSDHFTLTALQSFIPSDKGINNLVMNSSSICATNDKRELYCKRRRDVYQGGMPIATVETKLLSKASNGIQLEIRRYCELLFDSTIQCQGTNYSNESAVSRGFIEGEIKEPRRIAFPMPSN